MEVSVSRNCILKNRHFLNHFLKSALFIQLTEVLQSGARGTIIVIMNRPIDVGIRRGHAQDHVQIPARNIAAKYVRELTMKH